MGVSPSFSACVRLMSLGDVAWTASAGAVFYGVGFSHARQLGVRSAHSLGVWSALPAVVVGVLAGANKGFYRYLGFMDNGNAALYPGYVEDGAPYYLKHKVSDRRADAAPGSTTVPSGGALR